MMTPFRKTLFAAAAAGSLWLTAAVSPLAAAPTAYQATGPITDMTDTTITILFKGKDKWTFARDASTTGMDGLKVGDKVTVHYTMMAGSVETSKTADSAAGKDKAKKGKADAAKPAASPAASPAA